MGCRLSDHGLNHAFGEFPSDHDACLIFGRARSGHAATREEHHGFAGWLMLQFGRMDAEKGWTKQLHLGARRNANTRRLREIGPDIGFDSIGDWPQADSLGSYLDRLEQDSALPKIVLYNLNPADNYVLATMIGQLPGRLRRRQNPVRQRLVVSRPEGGHDLADERPLQLRPDFPLHRHAHRFAVLHVLPAP